MTDLTEQTAEQNPRLSDAKFANNSMSNAVVSELGTQDVMVSFWTVGYAWREVKCWLALLF